MSATSVRREGRPRKPPLPIRKVIGDRVQAIRKQREWTQQALADRLSEITGKQVGRVTVANIEGAGRVKVITVDDLHALALALGVSPSVLVTPPTDAGEVAVTSAYVMPTREWRAYLSSPPGHPSPVDDHTVTRLEEIAHEFGRAPADRREALARSLIRLGVGVLDAYAVRQELDNRKGGDHGESE